MKRVIWIVSSSNFITFGPIVRILEPSKLVNLFLANSCTYNWTIIRKTHLITLYQKNESVSINFLRKILERFTSNIKWMKSGRSNEVANKASKHTTWERQHPKCHPRMHARINKLEKLGTLSDPPNWPGRTHTHTHTLTQVEEMAGDVNKHSPVWQPKWVR